MEYVDYKSAFDRKSGYRNVYLKTARVVVYASIYAMLLVGLSIMLINQTTATVEFKNAHAFIPVK